MGDNYDIEDSLLVDFSGIRIHLLDEDKEKLGIPKDHTAYLVLKMNQDTYPRGVIERFIVYGKKINVRKKVNTEVSLESLKEVVEELKTSGSRAHRPRFLNGYISCI